MTERRLTIVFAGGGTGGHLIPGLAVAEALRERRPAARIVFVGTNRPVEQAILDESPFERLSLPAEPLPLLWRRPWRFLWQSWQALRAARRWLRTNRPDAVVGLGGFAAAPMLMAASRMKTPVLLLEQNVIPGRATRWFSRRANLVCLSFAETAGEFPRGVKSIVTGNPVRRRLANGDISMVGGPTSGLTTQHSALTRTLLVLGGSQGSRAVNRAMIELAARLQASLQDWTIMHQTGPDDTGDVRERYAALGLQAVVEPFFNDLPLRYGAAELVVARAGATTLAELACAGIPAVLIPYPHAARNHQHINARWFASAGAARIVEQQPDEEQTAASLAAQLVQLMDNPGLRRKMSDAMRRLARPDAADAVVDQLFDVLCVAHETRSHDDRAAA